MIKNLTASDKHLSFSYSELEIPSPEHVNFAVGDRSVDLFLDPKYFPLKLDGMKINLQMVYTADSEEMTIERVGTDRAVSMDIYGLTEYQKTVVFMYLLGVVVNDGY